MRYGIRLQLVNKNQEEYNMGIELYDYSRNYLNTVNMIYFKPELMCDIKKLIVKGIDIILRKEEKSQWYIDKFDITSMEEDEMFDYQLYVDLDRNEVHVNKIKFDLEEVE